ncbi:peptidylprolyl isomerase [Paenibacillus mesophilus]|uniref:peptidylprolyl isomerase n=1 Tax=Paenibacillus mesophilus TaxID=2582849 RepID=UPI00110EA9BD|nr:peptidylprolyl isomerase [Paenibacillus mesophilus]TMV44303.1 peptidylprolyl isomerase [Paenibacillus mesophilus]
MRSVKLLWGATSLLLAAVLVLTVLLVRSEGKLAKTNEPVPDPAEPGDRQAQAVAVIGGRSITYEQLQQRLADKYGAELLNVLLDREAIRQEAEELKITVSRDEMDVELKRMQEGYESEERFYKSMKEQLGLSKSELSEDVYYKLLLERIAIRGIQVSEAEVAAYIKEHPEEFKSYVQFHLFKIEVKTKEEAAQVIKDLQNGAVFSSLAQKLSIDAASAKKGGDLGWVEERDPFLPPSIMEAARSMKQDEISKPIQLKASFAVIQLKEKKEIKKTVDEQKKAFIRKELALQRAVPLKELVKSMREKRHAEILDPELR